MSDQNIQSPFLALEKEVSYQGGSSTVGARSRKGTRVATMKDTRSGGSKPNPKRINARNAVITGPELAIILDYFGVPKRRFARHTGRHEVTIDRWCRGVDNEPLPLSVETQLLMYHYHPWTRHVPGRLRLPLRQWGINRDDSDATATSIPAVTKAAGWISFREATRHFGMSRAALTELLEDNRVEFRREPGSGPTGQVTRINADDLARLLGELRGEIPSDLFLRTETDSEEGGKEG
jgi:hypothetical protein